MKIYLSEISNNNQNYFNAIRLTAAITVLISHSFFLVRGASTPEITTKLFGLNSGTVAVGCFFFISGYLITESIKREPSVISFLISRAVRIYPALLVMLLLTIFALGPAYTKYSISNYFSADTANFFFHYALLIKGSSLFLPGVFTDNPYGQTVNGSLWTLPWEVRCYAALLLMWCTTRTLRGAFKATTAIATLVLYIFYAIAAITGSQVTPTLFALTLFSLGASTSNYKSLIRLSTLFGVIGFVTLLVACLTDKFLAAMFLVPTLAYSTLCLAYLKKPNAGALTTKLDYSYGTYLYAFPIQQMLVATYPDISGVQMVICSLPCTLLCATLSWHLVEKKCLALKKKILLTNRQPSRG